jgi:hypothetical protein
MAAEARGEKHSRTCICSSRHRFCNGPEAARSSSCVVCCFPCRSTTNCKACAGFGWSVSVSDDASDRLCVRNGHLHAHMWAALATSRGGLRCSLFVSCLERCDLTGSCVAAAHEVEISSRSQVMANGWRVNPAQVCMYVQTGVFQHALTGHP